MSTRLVRAATPKNYRGAGVMPMGRDCLRRAENGRIKQGLGVTLIHPIYREGLNALRAAERD
jgi:hypothetical protein